MGREVLDDGAIAISYEDHGGTIRLLKSIPDADDATPEWFDGGELQRLNSSVASLAAFRAEHLTAPYLRLIVRMLLGRGYRALYIERGGEHKMPFGDPMDHPDWLGWWRIDLVGLRLGKFMARHKNGTHEQENI